MRQMGNLERFRDSKKSENALSLDEEAFVRFPTLPRQRADANPCGFNDKQIAGDPARVSRNGLRNQVSLGLMRQAIQLQKDHATNAESLADDQFAKIAIFSNQNAVIAVGYR